MRRSTRDVTACLSTEVMRSPLRKPNSSARLPASTEKEIVLPALSNTADKRLVSLPCGSSSQITSTRQNRMPQICCVKPKQPLSRKCRRLSRSTRQPQESLPRKPLDLVARSGPGLFPGPFLFAAKAGEPRFGFSVHPHLRNSSPCSPATWKESSSSSYTFPFTAHPTYSTRNS